MRRGLYLSARAVFRVSVTTAKFAFASFGRRRMKRTLLVLFDESLDNADMRDVAQLAEELSAELSESFLSFLVLSWWRRACSVAV